MRMVPNNWAKVITAFNSISMNTKDCSVHPEVGIYKRKQESKKQENTFSTKKAIKKIQ